jgi:hypothetical protein
MGNLLALNNRGSANERTGTVGRRHDHKIEMEGIVWHC